MYETTPRGEGSIGSSRSIIGIIVFDSFKSIVNLAQKFKTFEHLFRR